MVKVMNPNNSLPPIVAQISPSNEQERAILSRGSDIVVTAGAGTGKTRTLVARFLSLVADGLTLRSIFAITFTKKAAREMRNRIREEIRSYLEGLSMENQDYEYWREIYQKLDAARISTIHSLAADIIRQHPAELNVDPKFELIDEGQAARLKAQAIEFALGMAAQKEEAAQLFTDIGDWALRRMLGEMLGKKLDIQDAVFPTDQDLWSIWEPILIKPIQDFVKHPLVESGLNGLITLGEGGILEKAEDAGDLLVDDLRIVIEQWKKICTARTKDDWIEISRNLGLLRKHLKQKGRKENWAPANPREIIKQIQPIYDELIAVDNLDLGVDFKLSKQLIPALMTVFDYAADNYNTAKEFIHGLDFDDLEEKALLLLKKHPDAARYWQNQVEALLVDEYQDTNDRQRELVNLLNAGENKLFIVGDGKQSIYRFRGANVAVFRQEHRRIAEAGESFQLSTSYRSHAGLIENLNRLLEPVLGLEESIPYLEPFVALLPGREKSRWDIQPPYVELHLAAGTKANGALSIAANALAARISNLVRPTESVSTDSTQAISFGDIAVLCRASSSFHPYEAAFEKAGIPYLTIAGQGFYHRPEVRDLLNTLQALGDPFDDLALAGFLRSPVGGLSDADLIILRDFQSQNDISDLLTTARKIEFEGNPGKTSQLKDFINLFDDLSILKGRTSVADILSELLNKTGYLAAFAALGLERSIQNIRKLVFDAQKSGLVSISEFLEMITELRSVSAREGEAQSISEGSVQIMTVHQAKGLEFPVVVLGDATYKGRSGRGIILDKEFGLVFPYKDDQIEIGEDGQPQINSFSSFAYQQAAEGERLRDEAESDRLLYVAATRAEELLIVNGALGNITKDQTVGKLNGWLGKLAGVLGLNDLNLSIRINGNEIHAFELDNPGLPASLIIYEQGVEFDPDPLSHIEVDPGEAPGEWQDTQEEETLPVFDIVKHPLKRVVTPSDRAKAPAWIVGQVVHRALELWKFPHQRDVEFLEWATAELKKHGLVSEKELKNGFRRVVDILERFCDHDLFQRMNDAEVLKHEIPYSIIGQGDVLQAGSIDAMFKEGDRWVLVEFKTDEIRDQKRFEWIWKQEDYYEQVNKYLNASVQLLGQKPDPILCFLNYEKQIHLVTDRW
jgi:ATP-dependent helicase/nuclease subunit A